MAQKQAPADVPPPRKFRRWWWFLMLMLASRMLSLNRYYRMLQNSQCQFVFLVCYITVVSW
jgi:hypothetical protein